MPAGNVPTDGDASTPGTQALHERKRDRDDDERDRPSRPQRVPDLQRGERDEPEHERRHVNAVEMARDVCERAPHVAMAASESPSSSGSWLTAITMPAPILKPVSTVSEMKCTMPPQRIAAANSANTAMKNAVAVASSA